MSRRSVWSFKTSIHKNSRFWLVDCGFFLNLCYLLIAHVQQQSQRCSSRLQTAAWASLWLFFCMLMSSETQILSRCVIKRKLHLVNSWRINEQYRLYLWKEAEIQNTEYKIQNIVLSQFHQICTVFFINYSLPYLVFVQMPFLHWTHSIRIASIIERINWFASVSILVWLRHCYYMIIPIIIAIMQLYEFCIDLVMVVILYIFQELLLVNTFFQNWNY